LNILFENSVLMITLIVWFCAQAIKVVIGVLRERRFNFRWFVGTGGMPSSHAAGVCALATTCGLIYGLEAPIFGLATVFALITMFDAQGVRRAAGNQAKILNKILDTMFAGGIVSEGHLRELLGHTPFQVIIGALLGVTMAIVLYPLWL
jgi:acid phosphatase family membrane protein YuiD